MAKLQLTSCHDWIQGRRWDMEDTHIEIHDMKAFYWTTPDQFDSAKSYSLYCVFDGHGGDRSAIICEEKYGEMLVNQKDFKEGNYLQAISKAFYEIDDYIKDNEKTFRVAGTTAVVILIIDKTLYCGNLGDSEAFMGDKRCKGKPIELSYAHRVTDPAEQERVVQAGGMVKAARIMGSLAVARTLGDWDYKVPFIQEGHKDYVSREPHLMKIDLDENHEYIVLACDGLWDVATPKRAADIIWKAKKKHPLPEYACELLIRESLDRSTTDNVTVLVVYLNWE